MPQLGPAEEQPACCALGLCVQPSAYSRVQSSWLLAASVPSQGLSQRYRPGSSAISLTNSPATRSPGREGSSVASSLLGALRGRWQEPGGSQELGGTLPAPRAGGALRGMAPASSELRAPRRRHGGPSRALPGVPHSCRPRPVSGDRPSSGTPPGGGGRGGGGMAGVRRAR